MTTVRRTLDIRKIRLCPLPGPAALEDFDCGEPEINRSVERCCERHLSYRYRVFCALDDEDARAHGFYCLSISAAESKHLREDIQRENEFRAFVPFIYINYIAVRSESQNQKIGTMLLGDLISRCGRLVRDVGVFGIALHALTDRAVSLYERYGFRPYEEKQIPFMILPVQSLIDLTAGEYPN